ncbi:hypothetical protein BBJ28_00011867 [Nothophytophthora sp. Chile5]|nr:hypothetical protein BBJ28_00011867 [Nothophytophthora sp. Chile5]
MSRPRLGSKGDMKGEEEEHLSTAPHLRLAVRLAVPEDRPTYATLPATMSTKVQKLMTQPINLMFRFLQNVRPALPCVAATRLYLQSHFIAFYSRLSPQQKARIQVWLYEQVNTRIEGRIMGFDEYMNLVLDDAEELDVKNLKRTPLGRILLKGDTITLMMSVDGEN